MIDIDISTAIDLHVRPAPGSLMRSATLEKPGLFRLARRECELYCVQIASAGAWGRAVVMDGDGRELWGMPSTFTGSFVIGGGAEHGLLVHLHCLKPSDALNFTVAWRELDKAIV